jgi:outer membrane protein assembly factor BamB
MNPARKLIVRFWLPAMLVMAFAAGMVADGGQWSQWGRDQSRNMSTDPSTDVPLPVKFDLRAAVYGKKDASSHPSKVLWIARLGSQTYGNPVVSQGRVIVGTNDARLDDGDGRVKKTRGGLVLCFAVDDGRLLWQLPVPRLKTDQKLLACDHLNLGICSAATIEGDRAYMVTSRAEVICLDMNGQANGNDGPFKDEGKYMVRDDGPAVKLKPTDGDIIWRFEMIPNVPTGPHDAASSAVLIHDGLLYVGTSNGKDKNHKSVVNPDSPSLIALDKKTGRMVAGDNEKIGRRLYHGQWSSPTLGKVGDKTLIFFGGGDGICYAFEPASRTATARSGRGIATLKKAWATDCVPREYRTRGGKPIRYARKGDGPSEIIATPVFYKGRVYVAIGQDPEHGTGKGAMVCMDAVSGKKIWVSKIVARSLSTASIVDDLLYVADYTGRLHCLDARSGMRYWGHNTRIGSWSSTLVADGKVYWPTEKDLWIFSTGKETTLLAKIRLPNKMYNSPVVADGVLYLATQRYLFAIRATKNKPPQPR